MIPSLRGDHQVRRIRTSGEIRWKGECIFISEALVGEAVGIAELETGDYVVRFCTRDVGILDRKSRFRRFAPFRDALPGQPEPPHLAVVAKDVVPSADH